MRRDRRSPEADAYRRFYHLARWKHPITGVRARQLTKQPLCEMCLKAGRFTVATVCDHVDPTSKETEEGFFRGPFQSLCDAEPWRCHSSKKQKIETIGFEPGCDVKGRPTDAAHPWNRR
jgi:5-methylcytosine-specific restriction protein A